MAGEDGVARLGRFHGAAFQCSVQSRRHFDGVALQDGQGIGAGTGVGDGRAAGNDGRVVARHIADGQRDHARRCAGSGQAPAFDAREVFANAVHLCNVGAAAQQGLVDALLVSQRQAIGRQREQRRAAARDQAQDQVVGIEALHHGQDALGSRQPGGVGHRVRGFNHLNAHRQPCRARWNVVVARDHQAAERRVSRPQRFNRLRHRATGLARADDDGAPAALGAGRLRQAGGGVVQRQRALHGSLVELLQKFTRLLVRRRHSSVVGGGVGGHAL